MKALAQVIYSESKSKLFKGNLINSVIGIDAIYDVTNDGMKLIIYVAVNKYYKTSLLAICFVSTESFELYNFSHQSYLDVGFQKPRKAFTDRAGAHMKFFNEVWNDVEHCLCHSKIFSYLIQFIKT